MTDSEEETQSQKVRAAGFPQPIQTSLKTSPASEEFITKAEPPHLQQRQRTRPWTRTIDAASECPVYGLKPVR